MKIRNKGRQLHRHSRNLGLMAAMAGLLAACSGTEERVTFVTTTQLGLDADAKTQSVDIGFTRMEGVVAPVYENGAIPPVYADIHANASIFNPKVSQTYATGDAARLATGGTATDNGALQGARKTMFFGSATNIGLKLGFSPDPAISLGYKRQEFSTIPVLKARSGTDVYGSVLAHLEMSVDNSSYKAAGMDIGQFVATGAAAENLAPYVKNGFVGNAANAMKVFKCQYSNSPTAQGLQKAVDSSPDKEKALRAWLDREKIDVSIDTFVSTDCFESRQDEALKAIEG